MLMFLSSFIFAQEPEESPSDTDEQNETAEEKSESTDSPQMPPEDEQQMETPSTKEEAPVEGQPVEAPSEKDDSPAITLPVENATERASDTDEKAPASAPVMESFKGTIILTNGERISGTIVSQDSEGIVLILNGGGSIRLQEMLCNQLFRRVETLFFPIEV